MLGQLKETELDKQKTNGGREPCNEMHAGDKNQRQ